MLGAHVDVFVSTGLELSNHVSVSSDASGSLRGWFSFLPGVWSSPSHLASVRCFVMFMSAHSVSPVILRSSGPSGGRGRRAARICGCRLGETGGVEAHGGSWSQVWRFLAVISTAVTDVRSHRQRAASVRGAQRVPRGARALLLGGGVVRPEGGDGERGVGALRRQCRGGEQCGRVPGPPVSHHPSAGATMDAGLV